MNHSLPTKTCLNVQVQSTLLELEESNVICPYMTDALMDISNACHTFDAKEAAPTIAGTSTFAIPPCHPSDIKSLEH